MCLVGIKPKGVEMNNTVIELIAGTASRYRCGIGFAYKRANENIVHFKKKVVYSALELGEDIAELNLGTDDEIIWHGRAATHGDISDSNAHPYILGEFAFGKREDKLTTEGSVSLNNELNHKGVFMHNGIFNTRSINVNLSDTYNYGITILNDDKVIELIKNDPEKYGINYRKFGWAKLAFLFPDVGIRYTTNDSEWVTDKESKCIFSNSGYGKSKYTDVGGKLSLQY